jgi:hypothetical protein
MNTLFFVSEKNENCHISKYIISARFAKRWKREKKKKKENLGSIVSSPLSPPHPTHRFPHSMPERKEEKTKE